MMAIRTAHIQVGAFLAMLAWMPNAFAVLAGGGNATNDIGGYRIHIFTNSATASNFVVSIGGDVEVLVVAGGGGGGDTAGGGGGGGGFVITNIVVSDGTIAVVVGAGGAGATEATAKGGAGTNSSFGSIIAFGGGPGGCNSSMNGGAGGSGGGGSGTGASGSGGAGTNGQGYAGGNNYSGSPAYGSGGGGGAAGPGTNGSSSVGGAGGPGRSSSISGVAVTYAGGGGGSTYDGSSGGAGGAGGGGAGIGSSGNGVNGTPNTGGGGGGGPYGGGYNGGSGGSGIVIVRYLLLTPTVENRLASNVTATSACMNGFLAFTGNAPVTVTVYWGATDGGEPTSGLWQATNEVTAATWTNGSFITCQATNLDGGRYYYYRCYASNVFGAAWGATSAHFLTGEISVTNTDPYAAEPAAGMEATDTGTLTIQRDPGATNEALTVFFAWSGTATNGIHYTSSPTGLNVTLAAGMANTNVTIVPLWSGGGVGTRSAELTLLDGPYRIGLPASNSVTITNYYVTPGTLFTTNSGHWTNGTIWSLGRRPIDGDDVTVKHPVFLNEATDDLAAFAITNATLTCSNWNAILAAAEVTIWNGGTITVANAFTTNQMSNRVSIICSNLDVKMGGAIDVSGKGYVRNPNELEAGYGPGRGLYDNGYGGGGGYGGRGGARSSPANAGIAYGLTNMPAEPGSSGGRGGSSGGGLILVAAAGSVRVDGALRADSGNDIGHENAGGGSGGGIRIGCRTFSGIGTLSANGGNSSGGGSGGGGRIALIYDPASQAQETPKPSAVISVKGGSGAAPGTMGTLYFSDTALLAPVLSMSGYIHSDATNWNTGSLTISNATLGFPVDFALTVTNDLAVIAGGALVLTNSVFRNRMAVGGNLYLVNGQFYFGLAGGCTDAWAVGNVSLNAGQFHYFFNATNPASLDIRGDLFLTNGGALYLYAGATNGIGANFGGLLDMSGKSVTIPTNCTIFPYSHPSNGGSIKLLVGDLTVETGGKIDADGRGFVNTDPNVDGYGPGKGIYDGGYGGGAGYGGRGGAYNAFAAGKTNGIASMPTGPGSSGGRGGGAGGGLIWVEADGAVQVDGILRANSGITPHSNAGGGAGGGIVVICRTFAGAGALSANGGDSGNAGGGGGGRIAVWMDVPPPIRTAHIADDTFFRGMKRMLVWPQFQGSTDVTNGASAGTITNVAAPGTCFFYKGSNNGMVFICN